MSDFRRDLARYAARQADMEGVVNALLADNARLKAGLDTLRGQIPELQAVQQSWEDSKAVVERLVEQTRGIEATLGLGRYPQLPWESLCHCQFF